PMAEGLLKRALPDLQVSSAGLDALVGHGADPIAVQLMAEKGIDIGAHRARMVTDALVRESDLILVMDSQQQQQIAAEYPLTRGKVFRLGETTKQNIHDPYRKSAEEFRSSLDLIASGSSAWVKRINSISSSRVRTK
ncbi:MAG: low molecular weight protein-tyrosine-phosphatase, partial [Sideroxydans sp.]|nr:low molecular weight protein-tyrosine-phosphatase [Sideroxyarcus sp.]